MMNIWQKIKSFGYVFQLFIFVGFACAVLWIGEFSKMAFYRICLIKKIGILIIKNAFFGLEYKKQEWNSMEYLNWTAEKQFSLESNLIKLFIEISLQKLSSQTISQKQISSDNLRETNQPKLFVIEFYGATYLQSTKSTKSSSSQQQKNVQWKKKARNCVQNAFCWP